MEPRSTVGLAQTLAVVSVLLLAGCTNAESLDAASSAPPSDAPTSASPTDTSPTSEPTTPSPSSTSDAGYEVAGSLVDPPVDQGSGEQASGVANYVDEALLSYAVVAGDEFEAIAHRFDLEVAYLITINGVRRGGEDEAPTYLYAGDTINLSAFHILSIGDQGGVTYENPPPSPLPPQRNADEP